MTDLEQKIRELRAQEAAATSRKARAEIELATAEARSISALQALKGEFGAESIDQARELLKVAEDDLAAECRRLEDALAKAKGPE